MAESSTLPKSPLPVEELWSTQYHSSDQPLLHEWQWLKFSSSLSSPMFLISLHTSSPLFGQWSVLIGFPDFLNCTHLFFFPLFLSSDCHYGQTCWDSWPVTVDVPAVLSAQCRMSSCRTVVFIKIEMGISGSSWKDHDSLSPELVEQLRYTLWWWVLFSVCIHWTKFCCQCTTVLIEIPTLTLILTHWQIQEGPIQPCPPLSAICNGQYSHIPLWSNM